MIGLIGPGERHSDLWMFPGYDDRNEADLAEGPNWKMGKVFIRQGFRVCVLVSHATGPVSSVQSSRLAASFSNP
jgi:hypothetical protein